MAVRAASSRHSERGGAAVAGASRCRTARPCAARVRAPTVAAQEQKFAAAVTGANRGIGLEFVRQLTSRPGGACVVAGVRDPEASGELRELAAQLAEQGESSQLHLVELDVTDPASVEAWAARTTEICGGHVDLLLNNAGTTGTDGYSKWCVLLTALRGSSPGSRWRRMRCADKQYTRRTLEDFDGDAGSLQAELEHVFRINTAGPLMCVQQLLACGALGSDSRRSVVGNVTSKVGSCDDNGSGRGYAYRASKAALNIASVSLSIDYNDDNVVTTLLHPGWVRTRMTEASDNFSRENALRSLTCWCHPHPWPQGRGLIDADESAAGLLAICERPSDEIQGRWFDYAGKEIPW
eukprot:PRCOL_00004206-RA